MASTPQSVLQIDPTVTISPNGLTTVPAFAGALTNQTGVGPTTAGVLTLTQLGALGNGASLALIRGWAPY